MYRLHGDWEKKSVLRDWVKLEPNPSASASASTSTVSMTHSTINHPVEGGEHTTASQRSILHRTALQQHFPLRLALTTAEEEETQNTITGILPLIIFPPWHQCQHLRPRLCHPPPPRQLLPLASLFLISIAVALKCCHSAPTSPPCTHAFTA